MDQGGSMGNTEYTEPTEDTENARISLKEAELTGAIRQTAYEVHSYFGHGFLEKVYENALLNRLRKMGLSVQQQSEISVKDIDGTPVGNYIADAIINGVILVEVKAMSSLTQAHYAQPLNYLRATGLGVGLILNFGAPKLQVKRVVY
jgi:GxxExxY protein